MEIVREKLHVFAQNGFDVREQGNGQLSLAAVPFSRNTTFGKDDVLELVGLLSNDCTGMNSQAMYMLGSNTPSALPLQRPSRYSHMVNVAKVGSWLSTTCQCCYALWHYRHAMCLGSPVLLDCKSMLLLYGI